MTTVIRYEVKVPTANGEILVSAHSLNELGKKIAEARNGEIFTEKLSAISISVESGEKQSEMLVTPMVNRYIQG